MGLCDYTKGEKTSISLLHFRTGVIVSVTFKEVYNAPDTDTCTDQADHGLEYSTSRTDERRSIYFTGSGKSLCGTHCCHRGHYRCSEDCFLCEAASFGEPLVLWLCAFDRSIRNCCHNIYIFHCNFSILYKYLSVAENRNQKALSMLLVFFGIRCFQARSSFSSVLYTSTFVVLFSVR